jgi:hypothetical protein
MRVCGMALLVACSVCVRVDAASYAYDAGEFSTDDDHGKACFDERYCSSPCIYTGLGTPPIRDNPSSLARGPLMGVCAGPDFDGCAIPVINGHAGKTVCWVLPDDQ